MNSQELQGLYESYLEVYNDLDEELTGERKKRAEAIAAEKSIPNRDLHRENEIKKKRSQAKWLSGRSSSGKEHPSQGFGSHPDPKKSRAPKTAIANNMRGPGVKKKKLPSMGAGRISWKTGNENVAGHGMPQVDTLPRGKGSEAARRAAALKNESFDIYDIILSHLLDEGFAETQEAAEAIMVSMSEEWRKDIVEQSNPYGRGTSPTPMKVSPSHSELQGKEKEKSGREGVWLPPYIGPSLPQAKNKAANNIKPA